MAPAFVRFEALMIKVKLLSSAKSIKKKIIFESYRIRENQRNPMLWHTSTKTKLKLRLLGNESKIYSRSGPSLISRNFNMKLRNFATNQLSWWFGRFWSKLRNKQSYQILLWGKGHYHISKFTKTAKIHKKLLITLFIEIQRKKLKKAKHHWF